MGGKMVVLWIVLTIIAVAFVAYNLSELDNTKQDVAEAEQKMWIEGKKLGMSDAQIQAEIDAAKARAE